jgi:hypothetical protein
VNCCELLLFFAVLSIEKKMGRESAAIFIVSFCDVNTTAEAHHEEHSPPTLAASMLQMPSKSFFIRQNL